MERNVFKLKLFMVIQYIKIVICLACESGETFPLISVLLKKIFCAFFKNRGGFYRFLCRFVSSFKRLTMDSMKNRATVRTYADRPIEPSLLNELLGIACRSSNTGNMQLYSIVLTADAEKKKALSACHFHQPQVCGAPLVLTFCADLNRYKKWCEEYHLQAGVDNVQALTYASVDTVIAAQTFCVAAEEKGLGICYLGTTTYLADAIAEVLGLPPLVVPLVTISLGYPKEKPVQSERLPLRAIVHEESYQDYTSADIKALYAEKENLPENKQYVKINQKENLAQVFAEIRYTKKDNEAFSERFVRTLRQQGFLHDK